MARGSNPKKLKLVECFPIFEAVALRNLQAKSHYPDMQPRNNFPHFCSSFFFIHNMSVCLSFSTKWTKIFADIANSENLKLWKFMFMFLTCNRENWWHKTLCYMVVKLVVTKQKCIDSTENNHLWSSFSIIYAYLGLYL